MKDARIDEDGEARCWKCGAKAFTEKRTARSKVLMGPAALVTKKKLKCQRCGEYNDVGNAKPFTAPQGGRYRREFQRNQSSAQNLAAASEEATGTPAAWHPDPVGRHELRYWNGERWTDHVSDGGVQGTDPVVAEVTPDATTTEPDVADQIRKLASLRDDGLVSAEEFEAKKADLLGRI